MKWQMVDRIDTFEPWSRISGVKSVSLEEYHLLEPFGCLGEIPPSLIMESTVHLTRWLVMASSNFQTGCILIEIPHLEMKGRAGQGDNLVLGASVLEKSAEYLKVNVSVEIGEKCVCKGTLVQGFLPLSYLIEPADLKTMWLSLNRVVRAGI